MTWPSRTTTVASRSPSSGTGSPTGPPSWRARSTPSRSCSSPHPSGPISSSTVSRWRPQVVRCCWSTPRRPTTSVADGALRLRRGSCWTMTASDRWRERLDADRWSAPVDRRPLGRRCSSRTTPARRRRSSPPIPTSGPVTWCGRRIVTRSGRRRPMLASSGCPGTTGWAACCPCRHPRHGASPSPHGMSAPRSCSSIPDLEGGRGSCPGWPTAGSRWRPSPRRCTRSPTWQDPVPRPGCRPCEPSS